MGVPSQHIPPYLFRGMASGLSFCLGLTSFSIAIGDQIAHGVCYNDTLTGLMTVADFSK